MPSSGPKNRRGSVRFKVAAAATSISTLALIVVGSVLVVLLHRTLINSVDQAVRREVELTASGLAVGFVPGESAAPNGTVVQVVAVNGGDFLYSSGAISGLPRMSLLIPTSHATVAAPLNPAFTSQYPLDLAYATTVASSKFGAVIVYAGASTAQANSATRLLVIELSALALPTVALLTALISWWVVGRSLRPVEAIRREVAEISTVSTGLRVPLPKGDDEIVRLASTMNAMLDRLETATIRQRQFVADASHELRSPLASIVAQVELAQRRPERTDYDAMVRIVADESGRLDRLVDDLLMLAKSDERAIVLDRKEVDLDDLMLAEAERLRSVGRVSVVTVKVGPARVSGDRELLRRALRNLVDNAERYATSTVTFEVRQGATNAEVVIADDGPGVPEALRATLFDRFSRADSSRVRGTGGTGLGLAIVAQIATLHAGVIALGDSSSGARFVLTLPADNFDD